jgi:hypothetical protein
MNGLPWENNSWEIAAQVAAHRRNFAAAIYNSPGPAGPLTLRSAVVAYQEQPDHPAPFVFAGVPPNLNQTVVKDDSQPPRWAGFLVALFSKNRVAADALIGCMNERFVHDCTMYGVQRATILYWKEALRSLWPLIRRALGRAVKWAAIISALKRYFAE